MAHQAAEKLNEALRGEFAALETYRQALEKVGDDPRAQDLRTIQADHADAITSLEQFVALQGERPDTDSGTWGSFAKSVMGTAKLFGDKSALKALKEGEEHGLKQYEEVIEEGVADPQIVSLIRTKFIPQQRAHIESIDRMMNLM